MFIKLMLNLFVKDNSDLYHVDILFVFVNRGSHIYVYGFSVTAGIKYWIQNFRVRITVGRHID